MNGVGVNRRALLSYGVSGLAGAACLSSGAIAAARAPALKRLVSPDVSFDEDFDELWHTINDRYCYFGEKHVDWNKVRALYRPMAISAETPEAFEAIVARVLNELYDAHTHLHNASDGIPRWPLYDVMVERAANGAVRVAAISNDSVAAASGLRIGDTIGAVNGMKIDALVRSLAPKCLTRPDPVADAYTLNCAVAGIRGHGREIAVQTREGAWRNLSMPLRDEPEKPVLEWKHLPDGLGYIVIRSFADSDAVAAFDKALVELKDCKGLVIDMRQNGGGNTQVAKPMMGRFITQRMPYAIMRRREGRGLSGPWTESVDPRGPFTYARPVVVLTSHWSASMAEGFPMGMRGIGRATVVGTPMMQLGAAVFNIRLDRTGVEGQYSGEPVYDVHDRPRSLMKPDVSVRDGEDILAAGISVLKTKIAAG